MKKDGVIYTVIFSFIVAFVFVFFLALAHGATKEKVAENSSLIVAKAYLEAAGINISDSDKPDKTEKLFKTAFPDFDPGEPYSETVINGKKIIVSSFQGKGLWGTITGVLGVTGDMKRIVGLSIISHNETPGLGGRIDEKWFKDQFRNEKINGGIKVRHGGNGGDTDPDNGIVDGITGASRTSSAIEVIVNSKLDTLKKELKGGN